MLVPCVIVGDSTAIGIAQSVHNQCTVVARIGASTQEIAKWQLPEKRFKIAIVGAGSNDPRSPYLNKNLDLTRHKLSASRIIWVIPYNPMAALAVKKIAYYYNDMIIDLSTVSTRDNIHPISYMPIKRAISSYLAEEAE